ncbi:MAG: hypothetical protein M3548_07170 [Actinomycetota bacterium]|nr:hypothetical protein [Actinomycetota bacterium]
MLTPDRPLSNQQGIAIAVRATRQALDNDTTPTIRNEAHQWLTALEGAAVAACAELVPENVPGDVVTDSGVLVTVIDGIVLVWQRGRAPWLRKPRRDELDQ